MTHPGESYDQAWLVTLSETSLVFSVKTCNHAYIMLSKLFGVWIDGVEILMTKEHAEIREKKNGQILTQTYTEGLLECTDYKTYWISWNNGEINLGSGSTVGQDFILLCDKPSGHYTLTLGLHTGSDEGHWMVDQVISGISTHSSLNFKMSLNPFEPDFTIVISSTTSRELLSQFSTCSV